MGLQGVTRGYRRLQGATGGEKGLERMKETFFGFLKPMFSLFRKACLIYKTSIIVFTQFIFAIYDMRTQGITRGYWELQGVTGGFKGLQGVTRGYKGLQKGYKGLQGVTRGYKR